jgi:AcrR family transcriptional regulator
MAHPKSPAEAPAPRPGRRPKAEAVDARQALLHAAGQLFAEQGVAATTTREICTAAGLNPGAIHYHFGDKDGLYREVLMGPIVGMTEAFAGFDAPGLTLRESLERLITPFMQAGDDPAEQAVMKLFLNEMQRPSEVFRSVFLGTIAPHHHAMARLFARHIGLAEPAPETHQLVYGLLAMANDYCMSRAVMDLLTPGWLDTPGAIDAARQRLVDWGVALVEHERQRQTPHKA